MLSVVVQQALSNSTGVQHFEQLEEHRVLLHVLGKRSPSEELDLLSSQHHMERGFVGILNCIL